MRGPLPAFKRKGRRGRVDPKRRESGTRPVSEVGLTKTHQWDSERCNVQYGVRRTRCQLFDGIGVASSRVCSSQPQFACCPFALVPEKGTYRQVLLHIYLVGTRVSFTSAFGKSDGRR